MKIHIADFQEGVPTPVQHRYHPGNLDLEFVDLKYLKDLRMDGTVERGPETLVFRGDLASEIERTCGRCLKKVSENVRQPFEFIYETKGVEDLDTTDDVREVLILNHPLSYICSESCKGLCPHCGTDLNVSQCRCAEKNKSGALSTLKEMWSKKKKEEKKHG